MFFSWTCIGYWRSGDELTPVAFSFSFLLDFKSNWFSFQNKSWGSPPEQIFRPHNLIQPFLTLIRSASSTYQPTYFMRWDRGICHGSFADQWTHLTFMVSVRPAWLPISILRKCQSHGVASGTFTRMLLIPRRIGLQPHCSVSSWLFSGCHMVSRPHSHSFNMFQAPFAYMLRWCLHPWTWRISPIE